MERFNWTTTQIDKMEFDKTMNILFDDQSKMKEEPLQFIDQVFGT